MATQPETPTPPLPMALTTHQLPPRFIFIFYFLHFSSILIAPSCTELHLVAPWQSAAESHLVATAATNKPQQETRRWKYREKSNDNILQVPSGVSPPHPHPFPLPHSTSQHPKNPINPRESLRILRNASGELIEISILLSGNRFSADRLPLHRFLIIISILFSWS